ncbi:MAG: regulatory protein RecX [Burkholderiales bacterium]|nr:MAG: regulatory protein RecX [Burkholderiales bacterium]
MQLALPFPTPTLFPSPPATMNNRGMARRSTGESISDELTRTSETRRSPFARSKRADSPELPPPTAAESAQKLRNKALRLLTTREHSREELLRKLAQSREKLARRNSTQQNAESSKDDIEQLIDQLAAQGWQSDDRYAEAIVRRLTGQAAKRFIADKLAQAGIKKEAAQIALDALEQDEFETATALWNRRFGDAPKDEKERQRHIRFLLTRGFGLGDAFKIVPKATDPPTASFGRRWRGKVERGDE